MGNGCHRIEGPELRPTLWRTCRVLANRRRLQLLQYLIDHGSHSVSQLAGELDLPENTATQYLRALNARGLLQVQRQGREVFYRAGPNPTLPETKPLLRAISRIVETQEDSIDYVFHHVTAFTHWRRIRIIQVMGRHDWSFGDLQSKTSISKPALSRHVEKLIQRGYLSQDGNVYRCLRPRAVLPKVLVNLARQP